MYMYLAKLPLIHVICIFVSGTPWSLCSLEKNWKPTLPCPVSTALINIIFSCVISVIITPFPKSILKKCSFISQKLIYWTVQFALSSLWANILGPVKWAKGTVVPTAKLNCGA